MKNVFLASILTSVLFLELDVRFLSPLFLKWCSCTTYSDVDSHAQVYWLFCVYVTAWFSSGKTMVSILHVDLISCRYLVFCTIVASATRTCARMLDILRLGTNVSWCLPLGRIENVCFLLAVTASQWRNFLFDPYEFEAQVCCFVFLWRHFIAF